MAYKNLLSVPRVLGREINPAVSSVHDILNDMVSNFMSDFQITPLGMGSMAKVPAISVVENDHSITIRAELPSMEQSDIKIDVSKNRLTLSGEKKDEWEETNGMTYHISELSYGKFSRSLALPFEIDPKTVTATFKNGVLDIVVPKPSDKKAESQTIQIHSK